MKRALIAVVALGFAAICPAPFEHREPGTHPVPELSQDALARAQSQAAVAINSPTPPTAAPMPTIPTPKGSPAATSTLVQADQQLAKAALITASKAVDHEKPNPLRSIAFGIAFLLGGAAIAFGFKTYADRVVPASPGELKQQNKRDAA